MWEIELADEVESWFVGLGARDRAYADRALDRLALEGPSLRMPHSRMLGGGLRELRFACEGTARRITYTVEPERRIITLTTFRKQRDDERGEIRRARATMDRVRRRRTS